VDAMGEAAIIVALLLACLVALVLVLLARREAAATRAQAIEDAATTKGRLDRCSRTPSGVRIGSATASRS